MSAVASQDEADPAALCRRIIRSGARASLATRQHDADGWPYASLVLVAADHDATPLLLLSDLAEHTRNALADDRTALLFDGTDGHDDPLSGPRVTAIGRLSRTGEPRHRTRFLARHPEAAAYADFGDFHFYRLEIDRAHLVAGFGRIHRLDGAALRGPAAPALAAAEADIVTHMNEDHADAVQLYARMLGKSGDSWTMTGVDPEGADLRQGTQDARLSFAAPVSDADGVRAALVRLVKQARERTVA